ncbi:MAG TPA: hypothetical protein VL020_06140 [Pseudomonadales bacterium]|nr:hypothetical protein [Pseudomonadales bacterium]
MRPYVYAAVALLLITSYWFIYDAGKKSVLHKLTSSRIEVLQDGKKIDADVLAADDDRLICLLTKC